MAADDLHYIICDAARRVTEADKDTLAGFGVDDRSPSPEDVATTEAELKKHGKTYEFHNYEGAGHAFVSTNRPAYRPEQAVDAWSKIHAFFGRHLQPGAAAGGPQRWIGASPNVSLSGKVPLRPS